MRHILYSLVGLGLGIFILRYSTGIYRFMGKNSDAEQLFGSGLGGTHTAIQLFGAAVVVGSLLFLVYSL